MSAAERCDNNCDKSCCPFGLFRNSYLAVYPRGCKAYRPVGVLRVLKGEERVNDGQKPHKLQ